MYNNVNKNTKNVEKWCHQRKCSIFADVTVGVQSVSS